jgi:hypothetical protein
LHRKVAWLLTLKDAVDVPGGTPIQVFDIGPISHQPAARDESMLRRERGIEARLNVGISQFECSAITRRTGTGTVVLSLSLKHRYVLGWT